MKTLIDHTDIAIHVTQEDIDMGSEECLPMAHAIKRALQTDDEVHVGLMNAVVGDEEDGLIFSICPEGQEYNLSFGDGPQTPASFTISSY